MGVPTDSGAGSGKIFTVVRVCVCVCLPCDGLGPPPEYVPIRKGLI